MPLPDPQHTLTTTYVPIKINGIDEIVKFTTGTAHFANTVINEAHSGGRFVTRAQVPAPERRRRTARPATESPTETPSASATTAAPSPAPPLPSAKDQELCAALALPSLQSSAAESGTGTSPLPPGTELFLGDDQSRASTLVPFLIVPLNIRPSLTRSLSSYSSIYLIHSFPPLHLRVPDLREPRTPFAHPRASPLSTPVNLFDSRFSLSLSLPLFWNPSALCSS